MGLPDILRSIALPVEARVDTLEAAMQDYPAVEITPVHRFATGIYAREVMIPAGTLLTGKIHRARFLNVVSQGSISVWSAGEEVRRIEAPHTFVSEAGTRRVGYAHEDTVWTTIHATNETDLEKLEAELIEPHENPLLILPEALCLGSV